MVKSSASEEALGHVERIAYTVGARPRSSSLKLTITGVAGLLALAATSAGQGATGDDATLGLSDLNTEAPEYALYRDACGHCHDRGISRAPPTQMLQFMSASTVYHTLTEGVMAPQAAKLSDAQKRQLAEFLTHDQLGRAKDIPPPPSCGTGGVDTSEAPWTSNWGLGYGNHRLVPTAIAGIQASDVPGLELKWSFAFPLAQRARSHPLLAYASVFVGSQDGTVYALDQSTGCVHWTFRARAEVRTGIVVEHRSGPETAPRLMFGDLIGNIYALRADTGALIWTAHPESHPAATITATPTVYQGKVYAPISSLEVVSATDPAYPCCSFRGSVAALDAATGALLWHTYTVTGELTQQRLNAAGTPNFGPSGAPIWNSPAIDTQRGQLYVGTGENYSSPATTTSDALMALDLQSGSVKWVYQATANDAWNSACSSDQRANCPVEDGPDFDFGAALILARASDGRDYVIGGQKSGVVHALDPDTGALRWQTKLGRGGLHGGVHFGMAAHGDRLYVPISDAPDTQPHDEPPNPGLFALNLRTGSVEWRAPLVDECQGRQFCAVGIGAAITATPEMVFAGALDGYLRIHDAATGQLLSKLDTTSSVTTVSGEVAHGGSMDGATAPLPYRGQLYVNSGYNFAGHMRGNVLLVYGRAAQPSAEQQ